MRRATDTTLRNLATLRAIPTPPKRKTTRQIREELVALNSDFEVDVRSVQRDLERLSGLFPITSDTEGRANYWYWSDPHALTQIPSMSGPTAFALKLAAEHLKPIMPPSVLHQLEAYFKHADTVIGDTSLGCWTDRAAIIQQGPILKPPPVRDDVQEAVYTALLEKRRVEVAYRSKARARAKRIVLNPLGLVVRAGVVYLVATSWDYEDIRHYVLHRMSKAKPLAESAKQPAGFRLADHVREDRRFSYPVSAGRLELKALFDAQAAIHLTESRLSSDHRATAQPDGRTLIEATVPDTADLRWWLLGFGAGVEVLGPEGLRAEFADQARRLGTIYG
ncbi:MAG: WYL domain-containing protein [Gammaproteobacteria bacterium]|nr:WYL domain-containing protein [Gammaproteobacteria bacterium]